MSFRRRIALTTGYAEWDETQRVEIGRRLVPKLIDVTFPSTEDLWPSLHMTIEVIDGVPQCTALRINAVDGGREIRSVDLRSVRVEEWVENIVAEAAIESLLADTAADVSASANDSDTGYYQVFRSGPADEDEFRKRRQDVRYARQGARRTVTDDLLRQVAETYRSNLSDRPVEAVQSAYGTSYRTAARYVQQARARGFLPSTTQGKVTG